MYATQSAIVSAISDVLVELSESEQDSDKVTKLYAAHILLVKLAKTLSTQRVNIEA